MDTKLDSAEKYFSSGNQNEALNLVLEYIDTSDKLIKNRKNILYDFKAACLLIDIGSYLHDNEVIEKGIKIINRDINRQYFSFSVIEYNLGNGKKSLFDTLRYKVTEVYSEELLKLAIDAKNHYLRSLNSKDEIESEFKCQLLINTANALDLCGRPTEALFLYNQAISINSEKFEAHASKSTALEWLNKLSSSYTPQMLLVAKYHLNKALNLVPKYHNSKDLENRLNSVEVELRKLNIEEGKLSKKHRLKFEHRKNQNWRNYFLNNNLYLSQHSCYCSCDEAASDDILKDDFLPNRKGLNRKLILLRLIRRIKNEYIFARNLLAKSLQTMSEDSFEQEELLRAAYRICYGTLDKIARLIVISEMDQLSTSEHLIFEAFWTKKPLIREKAVTSKSYNLFALYSIATDLQMNGGELRYFKDWRNAFEHSLLVITNSESININQKRILTISRSELLENLPSLLRIIRSAIFSSVFLLEENYKE